LAITPPVAASGQKFSYSFSRISTWLAWGTIWRLNVKALSGTTACAQNYWAANGMRCPAHHSLDEYLDAWIAAAGIGDDKKGPLFRTFKRGDKLTDNAMIRSDVLYMIKRRAKGAGLPYSTCCHTFRATGITAYLQNGGTLEHAQQIAAHQSPRTTKLYDRTKDEISLDEVERIKF
jgi:integrase